ncbi:MAG: hypothetical protein NZ520_09330, partial [bacterium]|nr:hypothetical protein [bacterium]
MSLQTVTVIADATECTLPIFWRVTLRRDPCGRDGARPSKTATMVADVTECTLPIFWRVTLRRDHNERNGAKGSCSVVTAMD